MIETVLFLSRSKTSIIIQISIAARRREIQEQRNRKPNLSGFSCMPYQHAYHIYNNLGAKFSMILVNH